MIAKLKKTTLGKRLYRLSRSPIGAPLQYLAQLLQADAIQIAHLSPANKKHNQEQAHILAQFEASTKDNG